MSARPNNAPHLIGFEVVSHLGSGGFADVYMYQQHRPKRQVAIKVLRPDAVQGPAKEQFETEANIMASVSTHPNIVTIYDAFEADDGRPCIVMELYPKPNFSERYRSTQFSVADALRVGIQLSGAVETAHRAGILHRDIKPSNILTSVYDQPGLTDFGIAATGNQSATIGMSIPWAAPEAITSDGTTDERSDVYGLAATIFTLLANRAPFQRNQTDMDLIGMTARIRSGQLTPLDRRDIPERLNSLLRTAMSASPDARIPSALAFGRGLSDIERSLGGETTAIHVLESGESAVSGAASISKPGLDPDGPGPTVAKPRRIAPTMQGSTVAKPRRVETTGQNRTVARPKRIEVPDSLQPPASGPIHPKSHLIHRVPDRPSSTLPSPSSHSTSAPPASDVAEQVLEPTEAPNKARRFVLAGLVLAALAAAGTWAIVSKDSAEVDQQRARDRENDIEFDAGVTEPGQHVPGVRNLMGKLVDGSTVLFTWETDALGEGDSFLWNRTDLGADQTTNITKASEVRVQLADAREIPCVRVAIRLANGRTSTDPAEACLKPK